MALCDVIYTLEIDYGAGFIDKSDDLSLARIRRSFSGPLARVATEGRASFTMENSSQAYSPPLVGALVPRLPVRFTMSYGGVPVVQFTGSLRNIVPTADTCTPRKLSVLECVDDMELLDIYEGEMAIQTNTNAHTVIKAVVDSAYAPAGENYEAGINPFPVAADRWSYQGITINSGREGPTETILASQKILDACVSDWGKFFIAKNGDPTFFNRHHELLDATTELTLNNTMHEMEYKKSVQQIINSVEVTCYPRTIGTIPEVLGRLSQTNAPSINDTETQIYVLQFRDPVDQTISLGGLTPIDPSTFPGVDIIATDDPAGVGTIVTVNIAVVMTDYGDRVELALTNNSGAIAYIQKLQVRGFAIRSREPVTVVSRDAVSIAAYGLRKLSLNAPLMSNPADAQGLADYLIDYYKDPMDEIPSVTFSAHTNDTLMEAARDIELVDQVSITEDQTGVTGQFFVYSIQHTIRDNYNHDVTLGLLKAYELGGDVALWGANPADPDAAHWDGPEVWVY